MSRIVCSNCPDYTGKRPPKDTGCPGVETCKKIAANQGKLIKLVEVKER